MPVRAGSYYYSNFYPLESWEFELTKESSLYYEIDSRINGKIAADEHWERRKELRTNEGLPRERSLFFTQKDCEDINRKITKFLRADWKYK